MSLSRTNRRALNRRITKYMKFTLTNAQMLALNGTPITILAALPNFVHIVDALYLTCPAQVTGATIGSATGMVLKYTNGSGAAASGSAPVTGFLDQTTLTQSFADAAGTALPVANAAIVIQMAGANVTAMTGTVSGRLYFRTLPAQL